MIGHKEMCNAVDAYDALRKIHDLVNSLDEECGVDPVEVRDIARAALSKPPRNCDFGTPDEQEARFERFCNQHRTMESCCESCPLLKARCSCEFAWAQMPYEKEP